MTDLADLFPGFSSNWTDTKAGRVFSRANGHGEPLALLHGFPQTIAMWHRLAPALAERFSVVAIDLPGYGWSAAPESDGGALYSKRAMAEDIVAVMESLGHVRFHVAGHDRGARVAYRLALDHPGRVTKLALLDVLPTAEVWKNNNAGRSPAAHWAALARPAPIPETEIAANPNAYFEGLMAKWTKAQTLEAFDSRAMAHYRAGWGDPTRLHAMCEDYRAGATLDLAADEADLAVGKKILCPTLTITGDFYLSRGAGEAPVEVWKRTFAPQATGVMVPNGHFVTEEAPVETLAALQDFL
jgi:haloacetate dehalogenase